MKVIRFKFQVNWFHINGLRAKICCPRAMKRTIVIIFFGTVHILSYNQEALMHHLLWSCFFFFYFLTMICRNLLNTFTTIQLWYFLNLTLVHKKLRKENCLCSVICIRYYYNRRCQVQQTMLTNLFSHSILLSIPQIQNILFIFISY